MEREGITLYVTDMDGTLLGADSKVSAVSVELLNRAIEKYGAMVTCASARTPATLVGLMADVRLRLPMIAMNGAAMWDSAAGGYANVRTLDNAVVNAVVDIYAKYGSRPFVYRQNGGVIEAYHDEFLSDVEKEFVEPRSHGPLKRFIFGQGYGDEKHEAMIIFSMDRYELLKKVYADIVANVDCAPVCYHDIFDPEYGILEVYSSGTSKAQAIKVLAEQVGAGRIVVFGDNRNDIPMMEIADCSVAVANAFPDVKAVADEVIGANTENSVAAWIEADAKAIYERKSR